MRVFRSPSHFLPSIPILFLQCLLYLCDRFVTFSLGGLARAFDFLGNGACEGLRLGLESFFAAAVTVMGEKKGEGGRILVRVFGS